MDVVIVKFHTHFRFQLKAQLTLKSSVLDDKYWKENKQVN